MIVADHPSRTVTYKEIFKLNKFYAESTIKAAVPGIKIKSSQRGVHTMVYKMDTTEWDMSDITWMDWFRSFHTRIRWEFQTDNAQITVFKSGKVRITSMAPNEALDAVQDHMMAKLE
jgi:ribonuclease HIII